MEKEPNSSKEQTAESLIYTIGLTEMYDDDLRTRPFVVKLGEKVNDPKYGNYPGGSVWQTREEAEQFLKDHSDEYKDFSVYGVMASWETDTKISEEKGATWRSLKKDSQLVLLPKPESDL